MAIVAAAGHGAADVVQDGGEVEAQAVGPRLVGPGEGVDRAGEQAAAVDQHPLAMAHVGAEARAERPCRVHQASLGGRRPGRAAHAPALSMAATRRLRSACTRPTERVPSIVTQPYCLARRSN